ncbi:MAG: MATE family efflux transporter [Bacteroidota bacterium]
MNKEILRLAIPNILSNLSIPLLSTVDTALMGHLSAAHLGAVGVGGMIYNFIYWNFGFLRMGTTGMTAQAFGKEDQAEMILTLGRALLVVAGVAALLMLLQLPLGKASIFLMNVEGSQSDLVAEYFFVRIWAAPASLAIFAFTGWFFGMQNAWFPLILTITVNVINMAFSWFFVRELGWGMSGVAWGTVIAQYAGLLLAVGLFFSRYRQYLSLLNRKALLAVEALKRFLSVNGDIFIRTVILTFAFAFFYSQSADGGELVLGANVVLMQFLNWMSYIVDGFAFAAESVVGKYKGAAHREKLYRAIRLSFLWGMVMAGLFALVYGLAGDRLLRIFTEDAEVIKFAKKSLYWMLILPLVSTPAYMWDGVYIGLTASRAMRNTMFLAIGLYLGVYYSFDYLEIADALWWAMTLFLGARGLFQWLLFSRKGIAIT